MKIEISEDLCTRIRDVTGQADEDAIRAFIERAVVNELRSEEAAPCRTQIDTFRVLSEKVERLERRQATLVRLIDLAASVLIRVCKAKGQTADETPSPVHGKIQ